MASDGSETITPGVDLPPGVRWVPERGDEVAALLGRLPLDAGNKERLVDEASMILGKCIPPSAAALSTTGLVLGYVQSGKTLSFTTVAALARDNGFPVVIVITGTKTNLNDQSRERLEDDLGLDTSRRWRLFKNPKPDVRTNILNVLRHWAPGSTVPPRRRQAVLITVLKHFSHLRNLIGLLSTLSAELQATPVLIVDDEADQAGLNNLVRQNRVSTTYQRLVALRGCVPHHTYLQYTATPQAPLLISLIDTLSPQFAEPLSAGDDYTGGRTFFVDHANLVRVIPQNEIPGRNNPLSQPPPSLLSALRLFFLGVAVGYLRNEDGPQENRSMLVHPSRETPNHAQFRRWISQIRQEWLQTLALPRDAHERTLFVDSFLPEYNDLRSTVPDIPLFEELTSSELEYAIQSVEEPLEVNARPRTPAVLWREKYPWILVGGEAMERGFTVEGLTVTYMPREVGVGNADTIQQRARFFGYKRSYLGFCRVFLDGSTRDAFRSYVAHEEDVRHRLLEHREGGRPLAEWRRAFLLDSSLKPTRKNVLTQDCVQDTFSDDWFWPRFPHGADDLLRENRECVARFVNSYSWLEDEGDDRRTEWQRHLVTHEVPLRALYRDLLVPMRMTDELDSQRFTGLRLQVEAFLQEHEDAMCTVYQIRAGDERMRSVDRNTGEIPTLFQGANYADSPRNTDETYPGDERIRSSEGLTVQIHTLVVREANRGPVIASNVPTVAVWVPASMGRDWLVQAQS